MMTILIFAGAVFISIGLMAVAAVLQGEKAERFSRADIERWERECL